MGSSVSFSLSFLMWWLRGIHETPVGKARVGFGYCYGEITTARPPKDVLLVPLNIMGLKRGRSKILKTWRSYVMSSEKNFKTYLRSNWNQQWDSASKEGSAQFRSYLLRCLPSIREVITQFCSVLWRLSLEWTESYPRGEAGTS